MMMSRNRTRNSNNHNGGSDDGGDIFPIVHADAVPIDNPFVVVPPAQAIAVPVHDDDGDDHVHDDPTRPVVFAVAADAVGPTTADAIPTNNSHSSISFHGQYFPDGSISNNSFGSTSSNQHNVNSYNNVPNYYGNHSYGHSSQGSDYGQSPSSAYMGASSSSSSSLMLSSQSQQYPYHHHPPPRRPTSEVLPLPLSLSDRSNQPTAPYVTTTSATTTTSTRIATVSSETDQSMQHQHQQQQSDGTSTTATYGVRPGSRMTPYV